MRGGRDRDGLGHRVDAVGAAGGQDGREALLPHLRAEVPGVQVHVLRALLLHAAHDALGDDVAGGQLGQLVLPDHEPDAVAVDQVRALAADGLRHQGLLPLGVRAQEQHGRVELDELQVGDLGPGPQRERHPVAGGHRRVGGRREDLAHAAGRQDHGGRVDRADAVVLALAHDVQGDTGRTALRVLQQVQYQGVLDGLDAGRLDGLDERPGDLGAGGVAARVRDPSAVVAALAGQLYLTGLGGGVEDRAGGHEAAHGVRSLGDEEPYGALVAQPGTRDQRVVQVLLGGVAVAERRGDPALCPAGGAVVEPGLGDHDRTAARGGAAQCGGQAGDAGADDHDVGVDGPAGGGGVQPYAGTGGACAWGAHVCAPNSNGMLSISRVVPTFAATASTACPVKSGPTSVKSCGSTSAR